MGGAGLFELVKGKLQKGGGRLAGHPRAIGFVALVVFFLTPPLEAFLPREAELFALHGFRLRRAVLRRTRM